MDREFIIPVVHLVFFILGIEHGFTSNKIRCKRVAARIGKSDRYLSKQDLYNRKGLCFSIYKGKGTTKSISEKIKHRSRHCGIYRKEEKWTQHYLTINGTMGNTSLLVLNLKIIHFIENQ
ncbi:MAG: hypothetical protein L6406_14790 [Desulfobacterales bacterium]|nr:hypothetical protein [Desulfobacterales bacterium]